MNRANVAKLCGGCHGDPEMMAKYGLRTDQYEKWTKSVHGQAFRAGNPNAPTCTGCHGAHSSAPPDASSVARACGRCHEEEMGFFEQSPHSQGFRERGLAQCVACQQQPRYRSGDRALGRDDAGCRVHEVPQPRREAAQGG